MNAEVENLADRPELREQSYALIGAHFSQGSPTEFSVPVAREFPLLLATPNAKRNFVIVEKNQVVATASYLIQSWGPLKCATVGLVTTDPEFRGQGLAGRILTEIEGRARAEGAALVFLWSHLQDFYEKRGFLATGAELRWTIPAKKGPIIRSTTGREKMPEIYARTAVGPARNWSLVYELLSLPNVRVAGTIDGYAIMGKARDLRDTIHEIHGPVEDTGRLVAELAAQAEGKVVHIQYPAGGPLAAELVKLYGRGTRSALAFGKVSDPAQLIGAIRKSGWLADGLDVQFTGKAVCVVHHGKTLFETRDPGHLLQIFFGPWSTSEMSDLPPALSVALENQRQFPAYFWGFDSV